MMTSGKPSDDVDDDAGFVQHPSTAADVLGGRARSVADEGPEERIAAVGAQLPGR